MNVFEIRKEKAIRRIKEMEDFFYSLDKSYQKTEQWEFDECPVKDLELIYDIVKESYLELKALAEKEGRI